MLLLLYKAGIRLYYLLIFTASFFSIKARRWLNGREHLKVTPVPEGSIWFHFASLGEFEQGRPVLEAVRSRQPGSKIVITFFSPSGYEVRKNTPLADAVYYLPLDTAANAKHFIEAIQPRLAVFTKYEYWYFYFNELDKRQIPLYLISGIFRPGQIFFRWYGSLHRRMLSWITQLFVQDEASGRLLATIGINHVQVSGDTRFDRVRDNAAHPKALPVIHEFKHGQPLFIGGSTWPEDEELLITLLHQYPDWKFLFAPHEITQDKINKLISLLPAEQTVKYSALSSTQKPVADYRILIIDNIGMLSALYQYADIAYIGGGFEAGIHNTLEAAAFSIPVIFGPKYEKFNEARYLLARQAGFTVSNKAELNQIGMKLITDGQFRTQAGQRAGLYVQERTGATALIMKFIEKDL